MAKKIFYSILKYAALACFWFIIFYYALILFCALLNWQDFFLFSGRPEELAFWLTRIFLFPIIATLCISLFFETWACGKTRSPNIWLVFLLTIITVISFKTIVIYCCTYVRIREEALFILSEFTNIPILITFIGSIFLWVFYVLKIRKESKSLDFRLNIVRCLICFWILVLILKVFIYPVLHIQANILLQIDERRQDEFVSFIQDGENGMLELMLKNGGVDFFSKHRYEPTPLCYAAEQKNELAVRLLLQYGANPHDRVSKDSTSPEIYQIIQNAIVHDYKARAVSGDIYAKKKLFSIDIKLEFQKIYDLLFAGKRKSSKEKEALELFFELCRKQYLIQETRDITGVYIQNKLKEVLKTPFCDHFDANCYILLANFAILAEEPKMSVKLFRIAMKERFNADDYSYCYFGIADLLWSLGDYKGLVGHCKEYSSPESNKQKEAVIGFYIGKFLWQLKKKKESMSLYFDMIAKFGNNRKNNHVYYLEEAIIGGLRHLDNLDLYWEKIKQKQRIAFMEGKQTLSLRYLRILYYNPNNTKADKIAIEEKIAKRDNLNTASDGVLNLMIILAKKERNHKLAFDSAEEIIRYFSDADFDFYARRYLARDAYIRKDYASAASHYDYLRKQYYYLYSYFPLLNTEMFFCKWGKLKKQGNAGRMLSICWIRDMMLKKFKR